MEHKRVTLFAGHYGSGKTNIAVNYALYLRSLGKKVAVADNKEATNAKILAVLGLEK